MDLLKILATLVVGYMLFHFFSAIINLGVRNPLIEYCWRLGHSENPWYMALWWLGVYLEYRYLLLYNWFLAERFSWLTETHYSLGLYVLMALPIFYLLIQTGIVRFLPVLIIRVLCIPLDCIYLLSQGYNDEDTYPRRSTSSSKSGSGSSNPQRSNRPQGRPAPARSSQRYPEHTTNHPEQTSYEPDAMPEYITHKHHDEQSGMPDHMAHRYNDQYRASQSGDTYSTTTVNGETAYYNGDSVPFGSDGEVRTYDSDYAPFD